MKLSRELVDALPPAEKHDYLATLSSEEIRALYGVISNNNEAA